MIRDFTVTRSTTNATSHDVALPTYEIGDTVIIIAAIGTPLTTPTGWTLELNEIASWPRAYVLSKVMDGTEGNTVAIATSSGSAIFCALSGDGLAVDDYEVNIYGNSSETTTIVCPNLTTTAANVQVLRVAVGRFETLSPAKLTGQGVDLCAAVTSDNPSATTGPVLIVRAQGQLVAGAVGTESFYQRDQAGIGLTIAVTSTNADLVPLDSSGGITASKINLGVNAAIAESYTPVALSTRVASIDGTTVVSGGTMTSSVAHTGGFIMSKERFSSVATGNYFGIAWGHASEAVADCQTVVLASHIDAATGPLVYGIYLEDSSGNYACYELLSRASGAIVVNNPASFTFCLSQLSVLESSGTLDLDDIVYRGIFQYCSVSRVNRYISWRNWANVAPTVVTGSNLQATHLTAAIESGYQYRQFTKQGRQQRVAYLPFQIGDGATDTFSSLVAQPWEQPFTDNPYYLGKSGMQPMLFAPTADSDIRVEATVFATTTEQEWGLHADADGVVAAAASTVVGYEIQGRDGCSINGFFAYKCPKILCRGASMQRITVAKCLDTDAALSCSDGANLSDSEFTHSGEDYAIEIAGNGPVEVHLNGCVFNDYTTPLNVLGTTGTITIYLNADDAEPAYDTAGAIVVFDVPVATTTFKNLFLADGTSVLTINATTGTTISFDTVSGGSGITITLTPGVDYTVGDVVEIRQSLQSTTSYYEERTEEITTTAQGGTITRTTPLGNCAICNADGLDGADYTDKFSFDYINDELDIVVTGDFTTAEVEAWYKYEMTLQTPMEQFWGAWEVLADGSFYNHVDVLDSKIDNTTEGDCTETTNRRIYRSDGANPRRSPTTSKYSVDFEWREPVTMVATGSGVTAQDKVDIATLTTTQIEDTGSKLDDIHSLTEDVSGLRFTAKALEEAGGGATASDVYDYFIDASREDVFKADVSGLLTSTDARLDNLDASVSSRQVATTDIADIKAKTDNLPADPASETSIAALNDFDPANDTVAHVTLVDTNTDMRGTDNANTVEPDNATVATIGSKVDDIHSLTEDVSGLRFTAKALEETANGGATASDVYDYFIDASREDAFKANVSGLLTSADARLDNLDKAISSLNDFDPANDTVAHVTLIDTNADMRGTDGANTIAPDNATIKSIAKRLPGLY